MSADLDYLEHLARESARFAETLQGVAADSPVPSCPDWDADDLLWHLAEVQWFWGAIVRDGLTSLAGVEALEDPDRPADRDGLLAFFERANRDLEQTLTASSPDTTAWTWSAEQTVGFIRRRQAHEALIHRVDAELTAGNRSPMDPRLSADGVDEVLRVMYADLQPWSALAGDARALRVRATDTGDSWLVNLGNVTDADPEDESSRDVPDIQVAESDPGDPVGATITGAAADLDCWLWHRPPVGPVDETGDRETLRDFRAVIAEGID